MLTPPAVTPLVLDSSNEALSAFAVASAVLGTKLVFNSSFTIYHRVKRQASLLCLYFQNGKWFQPKICTYLVLNGQVFLTQEDCDVFGNQGHEKKRCLVVLMQTRKKLLQKTALKVFKLYAFALSSMLFLPGGLFRRTKTSRRRRNGRAHPSHAPQRPRERHALLLPRPRLRHDKGSFSSDTVQIGCMVHGLVLMLLGPHLGPAEY